MGHTEKVDYKPTSKMKEINGFRQFFLLKLYYLLFVPSFPDVTICSLLWIR